MSFLEQASCDIGENVLLIALSVVSSVQCCMVMSGSGEPVRTIFISHRPALRVGISMAEAASPLIVHTRTVAAIRNEKSCRVMAPSSLGGSNGQPSVAHPERPVLRAIRHPAAGERDVAAIIKLRRGGFFFFSGPRAG